MKINDLVYFIKNNQAKYGHIKAIIQVTNHALYKDSLAYCVQDHNILEQNTYDKIELFDIYPQNKLFKSKSKLIQSIK